eukprot:IDg19148t1
MHVRRERARLAWQLRYLKHTMVHVVAHYSNTRSYPDRKLLECNSRTAVAAHSYQTAHVSVPNARKRRLTAGDAVLMAAPRVFLDLFIRVADAFARRVGVRTRFSTQTRAVRVLLLPTTAAAYVAHFQICNLAVLLLHAPRRYGARSTGMRSTGISIPAVATATEMRCCMRF